MHKTPLICSLLMAFGLSTLLVGCEPAPKATKKNPPAGKAGSTTGGGAEVPSKPAAGTEEKPKAAEKAPEAPKDDAAKEAPKADEAPKSDDQPKKPE